MSAPWPLSGWMRGRIPPTLMQLRRPVVRPVLFILLLRRFSILLVIHGILTRGDTVIIPPGPMENLALVHGNIPAVNNDQITVQSLQKASLNNQSQPDFLRILGLKKAPPDLENLEADLTWEITSTCL